MSAVVGRLPLARLGIALLLCVTLTGCDEDLETRYGERTGLGESSVNGTSVLGRMFSRAGHRVRSARTLSPRLRDRTDVIVWFPDDFDPPEKKVRDWFETWLRGAPNRTLIYVGRDFDAAPDYWRSVLSLVPAGKQNEIRNRLTMDESRIIAERKSLPAAETDAEWFKLDPTTKHRDVRTLDGKSSWTSGVDPAKVGISLNSSLMPRKRQDVWLKSGADALVMRKPFGRSQLIVVANGSFLLNAPLVNHEHRKLAAKLIDEVGPAPRRVAFLESDDQGPAISDIDPSTDARTGLEVFGIAPFSTILLQLAAVGIIFCLVRYPIFGRPRPWVAERQSDFGRHVEALGSLLAKTRDRVFALSRLQHYQQQHERGQDR